MNESEKTVAEIKIEVSQVRLDKTGKPMKGFRQTVIATAETSALPSWSDTVQTERTLGRKAVRLMLNRDNMVVATSEISEILEPDEAHTSE